MTLNLSVANLDKLKSSDKRQTALLRANDTIVRAYSYFDATPKVDFTKPKSYLKIETEELQPEQGRLISWIRFVDAKKSEIFFVVLYTLIMLYIFLDKVYCKSLYPGFKILKIFFFRLHLPKWIFGTSANCRIGSDADSWHRHCDDVQFFHNPTDNVPQSDHLYEGNFSVQVHCFRQCRFVPQVYRSVGLHYGL